MPTRGNRHQKQCFEQMLLLLHPSRLDTEIVCVWSHPNRHRHIMAPRPPTRTRVYGTFQEYTRLRHRRPYGEYHAPTHAHTHALGRRTQPNAKHARARRRRIALVSAPNTPGRLAPPTVNDAIRRVHRLCPRWADASEVGRTLREKRPRGECGLIYVRALSGFELARGLFGDYVGYWLMRAGITATLGPGLVKILRS